MNAMPIFFRFLGTNRKTLLWCLDSQPQHLALSTLLQGAMSLPSTQCQVGGCLS